jgi:tetratricopeptide (TPR) repeat protein
VRPDPHEQLTIWLRDRKWEHRPVEYVEALDLTRYVRDTAHIELSASERLRQLAIALEDELSFAPQPRGWLALDRIYAAGRALDLDDADIEISRAISAESCAACLYDQQDARQRIILAGREAADRAIALRPEDALAHHALGMLHYSSAGGDIEHALSCFERAVALDSKLGWARLYRAHCLHDLGRWSEAAQAYSAVDPSFLVGPKAWRYDLLREQRAWCLLQAGERESALAELLALLLRYEGQPGLAKHQLLRELTAAAAGPLRLELSERLAHLKAVLEGPSNVDDVEDT